MVPTLARLYKEIHRIDRIKPSNLRIRVDTRRFLSMDLRENANRVGVYLRYTPGFYTKASNYVTLTVHRRSY